MTFEIIRPDSYAKREKKFFKKHPELIKQYVKVLKLLSLDPLHPFTTVHFLHPYSKALPDKAGLFNANNLI